MNIILFTQDEIDKPLPRHDRRTEHLIKVLHKKAGDTFKAGLLGGNTGQGCITGIDGDGSVHCALRLDEKPPQKMLLSIALGFPRQIQLRRILRALSSMGIPEINLLSCDLGEKSYRDTKLLQDGGAEVAMREGLEQARDTVMPVLRVWDSVDLFISSRKFASQTSDAKAQRGNLVPLEICADNAEGCASLSSVQLSRGQSVLLAVGPERGWSERERGLFDAGGYLRCSFGERAMSTETACIALSAVLLSRVIDTVFKKNS
ncbi:MAG: RsmE family RNA methyltransferase [Spirochaetaceae bacterium]|nr:RsmE family RNA methyltransferase [Spirochaetaceae bacterium]